MHKSNYRNTAAMWSVGALTLESDVHSFSVRIDELFPPYKAIPIDFEIVDNITDYVEASDVYAADYKRGAELALKKRKIFKTKAEEAQVKLRDFSYVKSSRTSGLVSGIKSLFTNVFGGNVSAVFGALFSIIGFTLLAVIMSSVLFVPNTMALYRAWGDKNRVQLVRLEDGDDSDEDDDVESDDMDSGDDPESESENGDGESGADDGESGSNESESGSGNGGKRGGSDYNGDDSEHDTQLYEENTDTEPLIRF